MLTRTTLCTASALLWMAAIGITAGYAHADAISFHGKTYEDVLVYKTSSIYYVKIPKEGRVLSVPVAQVQSDEVTIVDDPYYRDKLKEEFERTKAEVEAGKEIPSTAITGGTFDVPVAGNASIDTSALLGGGGKPLNITSEQVQNSLKSQGFTFNGQIGKTSDGILQVQLEGPPDNLTAVVATAKGQLPQIMQAMPKMMGLVSQKAPWVPNWLTQNQQALMTGQPLENKQNGVYVKISGTPPGPEGLSITLAMRGA